jgi:NitT/TauT family transport system substrate-binding protein
MTHRIAVAGAFAGLACAVLGGPAHAQVETLKVGWCARTVSSAATPFAVATKMGWFEKAGIKVDLVPLPGSGDCTKLVATGEIPFSLPSAEPVLVIRPQGADVKMYYTAYQGNIYGFAVADDSPIKTVAELRGKKIGVTAMSSAGAIVARALVTDAGMDRPRHCSRPSRWTPFRSLIRSTHLSKTPA